MKSALQKSPIPKARAFVAKALKEPLFDPNWHFHSEYQLFMVLKGSGTRFIGDDIKPFKAGDFTFTGPNLPHLWRSDTDADGTISEGIVVYFNENLIGESLLQKEESIALKGLLQNSLRGIEVTGYSTDTVKKGLQTLLQSQGFEGVLELLKLLHFISESPDTHLLASQGYTNTLKVGDTERMNRVYAHVMKNYKEKIKIETLAELTNMTPTSFSRYFKNHANKTFSEFVSEIRIGHACKLLIEQKTNVSQACYESGFQTLSNFNRQFKKNTKRTPLEYKQTYLSHFTKQY